MIRQLRFAINAFAALFFPHLCRICQHPLPDNGMFLCMPCQLSLPYTGFSHMADNPVEKNFIGRISIQAASSLLFYNNPSAVQQLVHQIKYHNQQQLALHMGAMLGQALAASQRFCNVELIVPLPLHRSREKQRGYNQAALLAEGVSRAMAIPCKPDALIRTRTSGTQTKRNRSERWDNVQGLFVANKTNHVNGRHVLLIDDVITTGASIEACGQAILDAGATLSVASLAFTMK